MKKYIFYTKSVAETTKIGELLGRVLNAGDIIAMDGDLGAGKTHFTYGIASGLGIDEYITSPTFTIVNEYRSGRLPLFHFDVYRLSGSDELYDIGYEDYIAQDGVAVIEWSEIVGDILGENCIHVKIMRKDEISENDREIIITMDERTGFDADIKY